ncbi:MAG: type II secretion system protein [Pirellulales bacterium]
MLRNSLRPLTQPARHEFPTRSSLLAPRSSAFTLVELLVVITIIAILASLLVVAATAAMNRARFARIKLEVDSIHQGMEQYKNDVSGGDYPPNAITGTEMASLSSPASATPVAVTNDLIRHFKKVAPRHREPVGLIKRLAGVQPHPTNDPDVIGNPPMLAGGMTPSEALVFWLYGFSSDPKAPITGSGGPAFFNSQSPSNPDPNGGIEGRTPVFPFEVTRLGPRDDDGNFNGRSMQFQLTSNGPTYRINFWQYYPPGSTEPLVYFDTSRPLMDVEPLAGPHFHALKQASSGTTAGSSEIRYANEGKFQILHCGLDDAWGSEDVIDQMSIIDKTPGQLRTQMLLFPNGPFTLDLADTVTNFTDSTLEDAQP